MQGTADRTISLKRNVRTPREGEFEPTERHLSILLDLHERRCMNTRQFQMRYGERAFRVLHDLYDEALVDRLEMHRTQKGGGSIPLIYALTNEGAELLAAHGRIKKRRRDHVEDNHRLLPYSPRIMHELAVSEAWVRFREGIDRRPDFRMVRAAEFAKEGKAISLEVPGRDQRLFPDLTFGAVRCFDPRANACLFFVEVDRNTEPSVRRTVDELQSLERKYVGYLSYAMARRHAEQFGVKSFRVLTITTGSDARVKSMADAARSVTGGIGPNRFLATNFAALAEGDPFSVRWRNAAGEMVPLAI